ncbi:S-adenosyl-L-methionine-dependent methyltransferase [Poronia punctata]|nr:S-adenosyl-L-methionine-dependent methyltransferase [Poronia punctata]
MAPHSTRSSDSSTDYLSTSTRPVSESPVPELDHDVSTTDDVTSDYLSTRTRSVLGPILDHDDGYGSNSFDTSSVYAPSQHFPTIALTYRSRSPDRSWDDVDTLESTRSVTDRDISYVMENGRRYCGTYYMPNDDDEQVRLQLLNQVYLKIFDGELTTVPLESPTQILDIGTAVGEWAIDMAELYPECEVTGTDISNIFERRVPQNVFWEIDDAELEWERPSNYYDLVHLRDLTGAFKDWEAIYKSAFRCLKPGGWIEVLDFDDKKGMHDLFAYFEPEAMLYNLVHDVQEASILSGRPRGVGHLEPRLLVNAGYVDVKLTEYSIPLKTKDGSTGKFWLLSFLNGVEAASLRLLTKFKGWSAEDVRLGCEAAGAELMTLAQDSQRAKTFVVKLRVLTGRKPGHPVRRTSEPLSRPGNAAEAGGEYFQLDAERDQNGVGSVGLSTRGREGEGEGAADTDRRAPTMSAIQKMAEQPGNYDGNKIASALDAGHENGYATEDWLRNVDHSLHDSEDLDGHADAATDNTIIEDGEEEELQADSPKENLSAVHTKHRPSLSLSAALLVDDLETPAGQPSSGQTIFNTRDALGGTRPRNSTL